MYLSSHTIAVLGATNTGKTHYAVERMLARTSGVIGLPLRLLAREVYDKIVAIKGKNTCALITGEERIIPPHALYYVCTVEAMPMDDIRNHKFACVVIDEVQMAEHKERGHIFTDRLLHARGTEETLLLGSDTIRPLINQLIPEARYHSRERFSVLSYTGHTKLTRLPKRSVVVAFSSGEVYAIAEIMRRNFGGCAIVMGGLSPRTRNAQAALYQSGEVDYLVATDAIGMGLNLDADHVAFASLRKFDGERRRFLTAAEMAQIAGRAGRFRKDGSFGTTGKSLQLDDDLALRIENHSFEPCPYINWRNTALKFTSLDALQNSLAIAPTQKGLRRITPTSDELVLERLIKVHDIEEHVNTENDVRQFWEICQIPDFRNLGPEGHARLLEEILLNLKNNGGRFAASFLEKNIRRLDYDEGSVEILSSRLAAIRTWTYMANKQHWLDAKIWIKRTRSVENRLSDALHTKLVERFVDRRTSALLKGIGAKAHMDVSINDEGFVVAEGHVIGKLQGLLFIPDETVGDLEKKAVAATASLALAPQIDRKLTQIMSSGHHAFVLSDEGKIMWGGFPIGTLTAGASLLAPQIDLIGGNIGSPALCDQACGRMRDFMRTEINQQLASIFALKEFADDPKSYQGARALANVLYDNHGMIKRIEHLKLVSETDPTSRGYIRNMSGKIAFHHVFLRDLMKPGPARMLSLLFAFAWDKDGGGHGKPFLPPNGLSSAPNDPQYSEEALNKAGYTRQGNRIIRFDILSRLNDLVLQAISEQKIGTKQFRVVSEMMAALGCSLDDLESVFAELGYKKSEHELTPEQFEADKTEITSVADIVKAKTLAYEKSKADGTLGTPHENKPNYPVITKPDASAASGDEKKVDKRNRLMEDDKGKKIPKRNRVNQIHIFYPRSEVDENDQVITPTHVRVWKQQFKKHVFKPKNRQADDTYLSGKPKHGSYQTNAGKTSHGKRAQEKISGYANLSGRGKSFKSKNKPKQTQTWQSKSKPKDPQDSPFAALAGLQFADTKKKDK